MHHSVNGCVWLRYPDCFVCRTDEAWCRLSVWIGVPVKIVVYPGDKYGSGNLRLRLPARQVGATISEEDLAGVWQDVGGIRRCVRVDTDADVVVVHRPMSIEWVETLSTLQRQGVAVVVDIDDDPLAVHPDNQAYIAYHPHWFAENEAQAFAEISGTDMARRRTTVTNDGTRYWWVPEAVSNSRGENLIRVARMADMVTVTTPALAERYAPHGRVRILRNAVPEAWLGIGTDGDAISWTGHLGTHVDDLDVLGDSVARVTSETGTRFRCVANDEAGKVLGVKPRVSKWVNFERYPKVHAKGVRLGIVPLADNEFNEAKSWLKGMEMAAWGIPFVASDMPSYRELNTLGAGELADSPEQWYRAMLDLIKNEERRADVIGKGLEVAKDWTIEGRAEHWQEAWEAALTAKKVHASRG